jgi:adenylate kinase
MKIMILGSPGSGKGTYTLRLGDIFKIPHISSGDLLRAAREDPKIGKSVREYQDKGLPVPDEIAMPLIKERLKKEDCKNGFILDGVTYNINQAKLLDKITSLDLVINLLLPDDVVVKKNLGRITCKNCGATYNVTEIKEGDIYMPPLPPKKAGICDRCGGQLGTRSDDTEKTIRERLRVYWERINPVIEFYKDKGLIRDVKVNSSPNIMVPKILEVIKKELGVKNV